MFIDWTFTFHNTTEVNCFLRTRYCTCRSFCKVGNSCYSIYLFPFHYSEGDVYGCSGIGHCSAFNERSLAFRVSKWCYKSAISVIITSSTNFHYQLSTRKKGKLLYLSTSIKYLWSDFISISCKSILFILGPNWKWIKF